MRSIEGSPENSATAASPVPTPLTLYPSVGKYERFGNGYQGIVLHEKEMRIPRDRFDVGHDPYSLIHPPT